MVGETPVLDLVDMGGVALLTGVSVNTVKQWRKRHATMDHPLPPPCAVLGGSPGWWREDIEAYARAQEATR